MNNPIQKIILAIFFSLIANSLTAQKTNEKAVIKTNINCDHCKECETCGLKFRTEMLKIKGVKMYELNDQEMTFTVYYNPKKTDLQTIKIFISKLGYDADEIKADSEAYENLDGCCKV